MLPIKIESNVMHFSFWKSNKKQYWEEFVKDKELRIFLEIDLNVHWIQALIVAAVANQLRRIQWKPFICHVCQEETERPDIISSIILLLIIWQLLFLLIVKKAKNTAVVLQFNATLQEELDFVTLITRYCFLGGPHWNQVGIQLCCLIVGNYASGISSLFNPERQGSKSSNQQQHKRGSKCSNHRHGAT